MAHHGEVSFNTVSDTDCSSHDHAEDKDRIDAEPEIVAVKDSADSEDEPVEDPVEHEDEPAEDPVNDPCTPVVVPASVPPVAVEDSQKDSSDLDLSGWLNVVMYRIISNIGAPK